MSLGKMFNLVSVAISLMNPEAATQFDLFENYVSLTSESIYHPLTCI